jgi:CIC family chloride channel protein
MIPPNCIIGGNAAKPGGKAASAADGPRQMTTKSRYLEAPRRLRAFVRAHEISLVILAALIGTVSGAVVVAMSVAVAGLHAVLFNISIRERLSSQLSIEPLRASLVPSLGGLVLGIAFLLIARWRPAREIDPIEANALHGGRMSFRGSVIVALQTIWSSGVGASFGLEAAIPSLPVASPRRWGGDFTSAAPTSASWSAAARRLRSPVRSGRRWRARSMRSSW